jgi:uncharacterized protein YdhG (YjbR/CyaY superfamily)
MARSLDIDAYIGNFPTKKQHVLQEVRTAIKMAAPQAEEVISYGLPAFKWKGMLVWFGAHTKHIGLYPRASAIAAFKKELAGYHTAKGSIQFPFDKHMPVALIKRIVIFRMKENEEKVFLKMKENGLRSEGRAKKKKP